MYQVQLQTNAIDKLLDPVSITKDLLSIECFILHCCFSSIKYLARPIPYIIYCKLCIISRYIIVTSVHTGMVASFANKVGLVP